MFSRVLGTKPAAPPPGAGQPLELVRYNEATKKFEVGQEALEVLRKVKAPMGVVSVCGRARQGLWMWSAPVERTGPDGKKHFLAMLDTEGIDAWDQTGQYSVQIFSLAVLLSSLFVYNQMGGIDEAALDRLSLVTEMTKHIRVRAANSGTEELAQFTPSFLWLLRDFYLTLEEDGCTISPRQYLEGALAAVPETSAAAAAKNGIRASIKSLFPDRDCFTLVRPMNDETKLAHLEEVPPAQLRPEFREGLSQLVSTCFARAQPKRIGSTVLNGPMLAGLVTAYVDAINNGAVPTIATAWQGVAESECRRAADAAEAAYRSSFNAAGDADPAAMQAEHERAMHVAHALFDRESVGDDAIKEVHRKKWVAATERDFTQVRDRRIAEAAQQVEVLINGITMRLNNLTADGGSDTKAIRAALDQFLAEYTAKASGPSKWQRLVEFMQNALQMIISRVETSAAAGAAQLQKRSSELEASLAEARREVSTLRTTAGSEESKAAALARQLELAHSKALADIESERSRLQAREQLVLGVQGERSVAEKTLRDEIARLTAETQKRDSAGATATVQLEQATREAASFKRQLDEVTAMLTTDRSSLMTAQTKLASVQADAEERIAQLSAQLHSERQMVASLKEDRDANTAAMQALQQETDRTVAQLSRRSDAAAAGGAGPADVAMAGLEDQNGGGGALNVAQMTIQEIKEWLTDNGHEEETWALANRKTPRVKKSDWLALIQSKQT